MSFLGPRVTVITVVIIIYRPGWSGKHTVFYWKFTAHHINQPAQTEPALILEAE